MSLGVKGKVLLLQAALVVVAVANFLIPPSSSSLACKEPLIKSPLLSSFVRNEGGRGEDFSKLLRENHLPCFGVA